MTIFNHTPLVTRSSPAPSSAVLVNTPIEVYTCVPAAARSAPFSADFENAAQT